VENKNILYYVHCYVHCINLALEKVNSASGLKNNGCISGVILGLETWIGGISLA